MYLHSHVGHKSKHVDWSKEKVYWWVLSWDYIYRGSRIQLTRIDKHPQYKSAFFLVHDASEPIPSPSGKPFDVAVQTMGLCSQDDPVKVLQNVAKCVKGDGKIILLEHGRSHYQWLNQILDAYAPEHWSTWGCWWWAFPPLTINLWSAGTLLTHSLYHRNKDIDKIVKDSGLKIEESKRYHFVCWYTSHKTDKASKTLLINFVGDDFLLCSEKSR